MVFSAPETMFPGSTGAGDTKSGIELSKRPSLPSKDYEVDFKLKKYFC